MIIHLKPIIETVAVLITWLVSSFVVTLFITYPKDIEAKHWVLGCSIAGAGTALIAATFAGYVYWSFN